MKKKNELIVKENNLIEGFMEMNKNEYKFLLYLISGIKKDDKDFRKQKVTVSQFKEVLDYKGEGLYKYMQDFEDSLINRYIKIEDSNGDRIKINWLSYIRYINNSGTLEVAFNSDLVPYLLNLNMNFTKYLLKNIIGLNSIYSIRIYELLKQYEKIKERKIEIDKLKSILGINPNKYKLYSNFKRKVILKAKKELAENNDTDIYFNFEELKTGRKVTAIKFIIKRKENYKEKIEFEKFSKTKDYSPKVLQLFSSLPKEEKVEAHKKELENLLKDYSFKYLKADITYAKEFNPDNFMGFLKASCRNGHYSTVEIEKEEKKKEIAKRKKEEKRKRKVLEEKIEKKAKDKALERYNLLSELELERYNQEYEKMTQVVPKSIRPSKKDYIIGALEDKFKEDLRELLMIVED